MVDLSLGQFSLSRVVEDEHSWLEARRLFPDWSDAAIERHLEWMIPRHFNPVNEHLSIVIQSFLLKTPRYTILVDACAGNHKNRNWPLFNQQQVPWLDTLAAAGARPEDIDFVMCTHMHVDHVGWNTKLVDGRWVPTFPNAKYIFAREEWEYWQKLAADTGLPRTGDYIADSVLPIVEANRAVMVERDHEIDRGVWLDPLPGHSPGQVGVHLKSDGREAVLCGDMMHHLIQVREPDWSTNFCTDQASARITRRSFLERYADSDTLICPAHFPLPTFGRINSTHDGFHYSYINP